MLSYILTSHSRRHYHNNASYIRSIKNEWPPILGGILCIQKIDDPQNYSVALYLRLSKEDDKRNNGKSGDDSESIKNQRALLEGYAKEQKLNVYDVYIDDGVSGTTFQRPNFERMVDDIEAKKVNMVVTKDMSRLGRDYIETGRYMECYFPEKNVRYVSLLDGIDTFAEDYNSDLTPFKAILNDMYAKDISKKITSIKQR